MARGDKARRDRVNQAFNASCNGIQIDMLDIPKVFRVGEEAALQGVDDETLQTVIRSFVETIRKN